MADRLISDWDARHFHIERTEAALHGGGQIAGRVHHHGTWPSGVISIDASCREHWRTLAHTARGLPTWEANGLWRLAAPLEIADRDATWAPFDLRLPPRLPSAIEARTIAWRYEIVIRRRMRHGRVETAGRTPLLHEDAAHAWVSPAGSGLLAEGE
jgi:hypothetical protein